MTEGGNPRGLTLKALSGVFLRIGNLTFGGGNPTVAALQRELVDRRQWVTPEQFALCYALARMTPGTNLFAFDTAIGWLLLRWPGAISVLLAASVPCCFVVATVTAFFDLWSGRPLVRAAIDGALAASVGILLSAAWLLVAPYLTKGRWLRNGAIAVGSLLLSHFGGLAPIPVLVLAALVGWFLPEPEV